MHITFRQLRLFLALADTGSVTAAARRMHVTQPTASEQLREITENVGYPLYEIISRRVHLTDLGKELAQTARRMVDEWDQWVQKRDAVKGLAHGRLRVSAVTTAKYFIPRMVGSFCQKHPAIDVSLEIMNRDGIVSRLRDNLDEIYVMSMPPPDIGLIDEVFMENPIVMIGAAGHPLAGRRAIKASELRGERFILREPGSGTRMAADLKFKSMRIRPQVRMELGSNEAVREAVAGALGLGVISVHALRGLSDQAGLSILDVEGFPIASRWHIVYPVGRTLSPVAAAFKDALMATQKPRDRAFAESGPDQLRDGNAVLALD